MCHGCGRRHFNHSLRGLDRSRWRSRHGDYTASMNPASITEILTSLEEVATLMVQWGLRTHDWCLLDGPAIKLHDHGFDATSWRDHLNVYVIEKALPWHTEALELTVPPLGSPELDQLLQTARDGTDIHLVPASRYYRAGFERKPVLLPSGRLIEAATLRGCSQVWSYKSAETVDNKEHFEGDIERIVDERLVRLAAALGTSQEDDIRERLTLLQKGYQALRNREVEQARHAFTKAAGLTWKDLTKVK